MFNNTARKHTNSNIIIKILYYESQFHLSYCGHMVYVERHRCHLRSVKMLKFLALFTI